MAKIRRKFWAKDLLLERFWESLKEREEIRKWLRGILIERSIKVKVCQQLMFSLVDISVEWSDRNESLKVVTKKKEIAMEKEVSKVELLNKKRLREMGDKVPLQSRIENKVKKERPPPKIARKRLDKKEKELENEKTGNALKNWLNASPNRKKGGETPKKTIISKKENTIREGKKVSEKIQKLRTVELN